MAEWSFLDADGLPTGAGCFGDEAFAVANTPAGCTAVPGAPAPWVAAATIEALRARAIAPVQAAIDAAELSQARPLREIRLAELSSVTPPAAAIIKLTDVDARVAYLRGVRNAMAAAADAAELAAIEWL